MYRSRRRAHECGVSLPQEYKYGSTKAFRAMKFDHASM